MNWVLMYPISRTFYIRHLALGVIVLNPFCAPGYNSMQKRISFVPSKQHLEHAKSSFNISQLQPVWDSFALLLDVSRGFHSFPNSLLSHFQRFYTVVLHLTYTRTSLNFLHWPVRFLSSTLKLPLLNLGNHSSQDF